MDPPAKEEELREIKEEKGCRKGKKERRNIIGAKNTVRRAWLCIKEGQMCFQIEAVV